MKKLKLILLVALITGFTSAGFTTTVDPEDPKVQSLNQQIKQELVELVNSPVYLSFCNRNLVGKSNVFVTVDTNGKIMIVCALGTNKCLNCYLKKKLSSRNLWTSPVYKGIVFKYEINFVKKS